MNDASPSPPPPPPPPRPPQIPGSTIRRYKIAWRVLLIANLGLGGYMFIRTKQKDISSSSKGKKLLTESPAPSSIQSAPPIIIDEEPELAPASAALVEFIKVSEPIPDDQQRELFKWLLEEKRNLRPKGRQEKERVDEEKAILKKFLRAESIPPL